MEEKIEGGKEEKKFIAIVGAGSVGLHIGGFLLKAGYSVLFIGRERLKREIEKYGLTISGIDSVETKFKPDQIDFATDHSVLRSRPLHFILVTLKAVNTPDAIEMLKEVDTSVPIVSLQNGVHNAEELRKGLPNHKVYAGMFPYNVVELPECHNHQASFGHIIVQKSEEGDQIVEAFQEAGLQALSHPNIIGILYGKLLFNLNNSINALSGLPYREELSNQGYRKILAACVNEALAAYQAAKIEPVSLNAAPIFLIPYVLKSPNWIFSFVASTMLSIDGKAHSSMSQDFHHKRKTEIEMLNGEIVALGEKFGVPTPVNRKIMELVREVETTWVLPNFKPEELAQRLELQL